MFRASTLASIANKRILLQQQTLFAACNASSAQRAFHAANAVARAEITTEMVKKLRKDTDAPLGQCKKALEESEGDMDKAKEWLRKKGVQLAAKKQGREAVQGVVGAFVTDDGSRGVIIEINTETDFIARNEKFQTAVDMFGGVAVQQQKPVDEAALLAQPSGNGSKTLSDELTDLVGAIGENIRLRRVRYVLAEENGAVGKYVHNIVKGDHIGQMGSIVAVKAAPGAQLSQGQLADLARDLATHITAMQPKYLRRQDVPAEVIAREEAILKEKAVNEGKNVDKLDKIIVGQLNKFYQDVVLLDQSWVRDDKISVEKYLKQNGVVATDFARFKAGQQDDAPAAATETKAE